MKARPKKTWLSFDQLRQRYIRVELRTRYNCLVHTQGPEVPHHELLHTASFRERLSLP